VIELFLKHWIKVLIAGVLALLAVAFFQNRKPEQLARKGDSLRIEYHGDTAAYALDTLHADSVLHPFTPEVKTAVHRERKSAVTALKTGEARVANLTEQLHVARPSAWLFVRPSYPIGGAAALEAGIGIRALGGRLEVGPELREKQRTRVVVSYQRDFRLY
jgi:hypothetical protein